eukprot:849036-Amphidinium_carterae.1
MRSSRWASQRQPWRESSKGNGSSPPERLDRCSSSQTLLQATRGPSLICSQIPVPTLRPGGGFRNSNGKCAEISLEKCLITLRAASSIWFTPEIC